jgi:hypothetical protein
MTKCPICKAPATQKFGLKLFCGFEHAAQWAKAQADKSKAKKQKEFNAETRRRKVALKSRSDWLKDLQVVFNRFIRLRDAGNPCISCGRNSGAKMNAGHYLSVGSHPELRFNELNTNIQCEHCNSFKSGNQAAYRVELIKKIGLEQVEKLESKHEPLKLTIDEIKVLIAEYKSKIKQLESLNA